MLRWRCDCSSGGPDSPPSCSDAGARHWRPDCDLLVVHAVLLRPLPYPEPDRVVRFRMASRSPRRPRQLRRHARDNRAHVGRSARPPSSGWRSSTIARSRCHTGRAVQAHRALPRRPSSSSCSASRRSAATSFDQATTDGRQIVLSHETWERHLARDWSIIGRSIAMDGEAYQVAGVMPVDFRVPHAGGGVLGAPRPDRQAGRPRHAAAGGRAAAADATLAGVIRGGRQVLERDERSTGARPTTLFARDAPGSARRRQSSASCGS